MLTSKQMWRKQRNLLPAPALRRSFSDDAVQAAGIGFPFDSISDSMSNHNSCSSFETNSEDGASPSTPTKVEVPVKQNKKKLRFDNLVRVTLIPSLMEYREAGLSLVLWCSQNELQCYKDDAYLEIRDFMRENNCENFNVAMKSLFQSQQNCGQNTLNNQYISHMLHRQQPQPVLHMPEPCVMHTAPVVVASQPACNINFNSLLHNNTAAVVPAPVAPVSVPMLEAPADAGVVNYMPPQEENGEQPSRLFRYRASVGSENDFFRSSASCDSLDGMGTARESSPPAVLPASAALGPPASPAHAARHPLMNYYSPPPAASKNNLQYYTNSQGAAEILPMSQPSTQQSTPQMASRQSTEDMNSADDSEGMSVISEMDDVTPPALIGKHAHVYGGAHGMLSKQFPSIPYNCNGSSSVPHGAMGHQHGYPQGGEVQYGENVNYLKQQAQYNPNHPSVYRDAYEYQQAQQQMQMQYYNMQLNNNQNGAQNMNPNANSNNNYVQYSNTGFSDDRRDRGQTF